MAYDLLIRGGTVIDGSGQPGFRANVAVKDGRIVAVGDETGAAARTINADGLVVAPGFIDLHTHLDAQALWDPYCSPVPQHGITSVILGNCGLTLAPVNEASREAIIKTFARVEAIPRELFEQALSWSWQSFGDYLNTMEGRLGVNVGGLVGHVAVRHYVMGEDAVERTATPDEVEQMRGLVTEGMEAGALGFSTNRNDTHIREDGKPVASRLADDTERFALFDVLGELNSGTINISSPGSGHSLEHFAWYEEIARRTRRPLVWQSVLHRWNSPDLWREQLDAIAPVFQHGHRAYALTNTAPFYVRFNLKNAQIFDEFPTWKAIMFAPEAVRKQAFAEPETRQKLRADLAVERLTVFHRRWNLVNVISVAKPQNEVYLHKSVTDIAQQRGQDPLDAFLDLALDEDLQTMFETAIVNADPDAVGQILRSPYVLAGQSDAGAHVQYLANYGYSTTLLGFWARERGVLSLERAVKKLTSEVADAYEIAGRGYLRPGYAADLAIFDPATVKPLEAEWQADYPGGLRRLVQRAEGMHYTITNGRVICEDGKISGELAGSVLRGTAYKPAVAAG